MYAPNCRTRSACRAAPRTRCPRGRPKNANRLRDTPIRITPFDADVLYQNDDPVSSQRFLAWINAWVVLTAVLNETARSMGRPDICYQIGDRRR